ncbi:hypothetical protein M2D63_021095 [Pseudomonas sp. BJa5]|uniref:hypothetical protein n=1 Tax=Pseudomonas sp. BJa5 TaxID=2936270 RepID=UPI002559E7DD|nr:hypothetical protein [Pseudomonas sp. BGr12]MDL2423610.1 hypothetical protein [Pseudomonas sp. BGr12]
MTSSRTLASGLIDASILRLDAPVIPKALPLLEDESAWHIHRRHRQEPLAVRVEQVWPNHAVPVPTVVELIWDGDPVGEPVELPALFQPNDHFPLTLWLPEECLGFAGNFRLIYRVTALNPADSMPLLVRLDSEAPNFGGTPGRLGFPDPIDTTGITEEYLQNNDDQVLATISKWPDIRLEDRVYYFWDLDLLNGFPRIEEADGHVEITDTNQDPVIVPFSGAFLRTRRNGPHTVHCILEDRSGNSGPASLAASVTVALEVLPDLPLPRVPLVEDGLIDLVDAVTGVWVEVPLIEGAQPGDVLQVYWNGEALALYELNDPQQWPAAMDVPWEVLSKDALYERQPPVRVYYRWQRSGSFDRRSESIFVDVDLTVAGPVHPEFPAPENPLLLPLPVVRGEQGDNQLGDPDFELDARVELELPERMSAGDRLELFWGRHPDPVDSHQVQPGEEAGSLVSFRVPWSIILEQGNHPALPMFYRTFNGVNYQRSQAVEVLVDISRIAVLAWPEFPDADRWGWIKCNSPHAPSLGVRVRIPGDQQQLQEGDRCEVIWQGCRNNNGSDFIAATFQVIARPAPLDPTEAEEGFIELQGSFDPFIREPATINGSARVYYRIQRDDGSLLYSKVNIVRLSILYPGTGYLCLGAYV